ncbi:MAG: hypothetical protein BroJett018_26460 [Chloroflexota bacterium]|nr:MAG: hypothetical protein BroJett018_26460 [Chloroflexota bacterium]
MIGITILMSVITTMTCHTTLRRIGPFDIVRQIPLTDHAIVRALFIETVYGQRYILSVYAGVLLGLTILESFLPHLWNFVRDLIAGTDPTGPRSFSSHEYLQHGLFWLTTNTGIWLLLLTACAIGVLSAVTQKSSLFAPLMATFLTVASVVVVTLLFFSSLRYKVDFRAPGLWSISAACISCPGLALLLVGIFMIITTRRLAHY